MGPGAGEAGPRGGARRGQEGQERASSRRFRHGQEALN